MQSTYIRYLDSYFLILMLCLLFMPSAFAHVPLNTGDNESIETATFISDTRKSWAVYTELHEGGEAQYYRLEMIGGQRLFVQLFVPAKSNFTPGLAIIGPNLEHQGIETEEHEYIHEESNEEHEHDVPDFVVIPQGLDVMVVDISRVEVTYEPFSPGSLSELAKIDFEVPTTGNYYVAIYSLSEGGKYGLAIGYLETWNLTEWIQIPIAVLGVHQWEGQSLSLILAPILAIVIIGLGLLVWRYNKGAKKPRIFYGLVGSIAGLLFLGSGAIVFTQMAIALSLVTLMPEPGWIMITIVFALMPILLGIGTLRLTLKSQTITVRSRIILFILGIAALFAWAGLIIGPVLAILASILPVRNRAR